MAARADRDRVCLGAISGPRGLKGEVRIKSFTATPEDIAAYGPLENEAGDRTFEIKILGMAKGMVIARIKGVDDRTQVEKLGKARLYIERERLPEAEEDEYYHMDLIGLTAESVAESAIGPLGRVRAVHDFGAGPILELAGGEHGTVLVPFTKAAVPMVDIPGGRVVIDPPDGLIGDGLVGEGEHGGESGGGDDRG